ncbi:MAG: hypothetical protein DRQ14_09060 [Candidatus Latescibacterota bacterium]|nr:MAG: hypothetical protein DRQ14_09060 [Candidatus Latescibacterota bacterium]
MNIDEVVVRACREPTLLDALTRICVWESERVVAQAMNGSRNGQDGAGWDTCFRLCLSKVMDEYASEEAVI